MTRKKQKEAIWFTVIIVLMLSLFAGFSAGGGSKIDCHGKLQVHFIDVGQGDSIYVCTPRGDNLLIDSGDNKAASKVIGYLKARGVKKLDIAIATHPDTDHIGAMDDVVNTFEVKSFYMPEVKSESQNYKNLLNALEKKKLKAIPLYALDSFDLSNGKGDCFFDIYSPVKGKHYPDTNSYSIVGRLRYKDTCFMLTGDATRENEEDMIDTGFKLDSNVLKLGHHGSKTSSSLEFLTYVNPDIAVVSAGKNNKYSHPHKETLENLEQLGVPYVSTADEGDIVFISDGKKVSLIKNQNQILDMAEKLLQMLFKF